MKTCDNPLSRASLVYYPNQPSELGDDQYGVSAHTDFGVLTVLCQDDVGGLQIQDINGDWFHAPPIKTQLLLMSQIYFQDGLLESINQRLIEL